MGKAIIVKGADFSANGMSPYNLLLGITDEQFDNSTSAVNTGNANGSIIYTEPLNTYSGVSTIYGIKLKIAQEGIIPIYTATFTGDTGSNIDSNYVHITDLQITSDMVNKVTTILFPNPIQMSTGKKIVFGKASGPGQEIDMTAKWYYSNNVAGVNIELNMYGSGWQEISNSSLSIDYLI